MLARRLLLAGGGGSFATPTWTRGTLTPDGSPQTIVNDSEHNAFPGICWLDATRCLLVYRRGNDHLTDGEVYGKIGTVTGTSVSWGSAFLIYTNAEDVRCEDAVSIVDDQVVIVARLFDGSVNHSPFLIIADDPPASFTSSTTWGAPVSIPLTVGATQNLCIGRVQKLGNGTYVVGYNEFDPAFAAGVLISASLTDWSAMNIIQIGASLNELDIEDEGGGNLTVHLRSESPIEHYVSTSADYGQTWTSPASVFSAYGYPMWRILASGLRLTVYRDAGSPNETYWRQSDDDGATWSSETLLDGTDINGQVSQSAYATLLQLDSTNVLCVYSIEETSGLPADLYSQVFADSSTFG
jgi:hypothetical protein